MATESELLETLNTEQAAIGTSDLADKVKASVEGTRKQLKRLKDKGCVEGDSQEGWTITEGGKKTLERGPSMIGEGVTPRQKFEEIGQLIGIKPERITLATRLAWSGDFNDLVWVWNALEQADIDVDLRRVWVNSWRAHLKKGIPPGLELQLAGKAKEVESERATEEKTRGGISYRLDENDMPFYVGDGLGDLTYKDAVDLAKIRAAARVARPMPGAQTSPQQSTAEEIIKIVNAVREWGGGQEGQKSYVVTPGEKGAVVQEVEPGKPLVIPSPTASQPITYVVDGSEVRELKPGEPLVIKKEAAAPPASKTFVVRQTSEGIVAEEHDLSKPIIINPSPSPSLPGFPFPVMDSDGKPVLGSDGQPVYANIEPMLKYMSFQSEQRRADERHGALMELTKTVKENLPAGIEAFKRAVGEVKGKAPESEAPPTYECGECHAKFTLTRVPREGEKVPCPTCGHEWTAEEVTA